MSVHVEQPGGKRRVAQTPEARANRRAAGAKAAAIKRRMAAIGARVGTPEPAPVDGSIAAILDRLRAHAAAQQAAEAAE